jgi:hypothetical protein
MEKRELEEGDIIQINPKIGRYAGFFLIVTEPKSWGAQGYLLHYEDFMATRYKGRAFLRVRFDEIEFCGKSQWIVKEKIDE